MKRGQKSEPECKADFYECSTDAAGTTTTTERELPAFLTSTPDPENPIKDIDLPEYVPVITEGPTTTTTPKPEEGKS